MSQVHGLGRAALPLASAVVAGVLAVGWLAGCATAPAQPPLPPPPAHANGQVLWHILHDLCVPDQRVHGAPAPCAQVSIADGEASGFVVLKDRAGVAQQLVMPTAPISGVEAPALLKAETPNYFAIAWDQRRWVEQKLGHPLARGQVSIAANSIYGRSQDQLHLHLDCADAAVTAALKPDVAPASGRWVGLTLKDHAYRVRWLSEADLRARSPFRILADDVPGARAGMAAWTLALVGAVRTDGRQGFYLLADRADPATKDWGSAEELQDHDCRL